MSPPASAALERVDVVERHDRGGRGRIDRDPERARREATTRPSASSIDQRLVDGAVVAPVEHEDAPPPGDEAGDAQGEAVGVGGAERELPRRQRRSGGASSPATHAASAVGSIVVAPRPARSATVAVTAGTAWPPIAPVSPRQRSTYSWPSTSRNVPAAASATNSGKSPGQRRIHAIGTPASEVRDRRRRQARPSAGARRGSGPRSRSCSSASRAAVEAAASTGPVVAMTTGPRACATTSARRSPAASGLPAAARRRGPGPGRTGRRRRARPDRRRRRGTTGPGSARTAACPAVADVDDHGAARRRRVDGQPSTSHRRSTPGAGVADQLGVLVQPALAGTRAA